MQKQISRAIKTYEHAKRTQKTQNKTTCKDFLRVTQTTTDAPGETKLYVKLNSARNHSVATIHSSRAGYNDTASI